MFATVGILSAITGAIGHALFESNDNVEAIKEELKEAEMEVIKMYKMVISLENF